MKKLVVFALSLFFICHTNNAQDNKIPQEVKEYIQALVNNDKNVGISVAFINNKDVDYYSFGKTALKNGTDVNENSVYEIGSISKVFTAVLLAEKVKKGAMSLDDPISKYLPKTVKVPTRNGKVITLKDLATHTSGLPRMPSNFESENPNNPFADYTYEQLYNCISGYKLTRDIGVQYEYSNLGMGLLGHILELQSGKTYQELMIDKIANPLKMNATRLVFTETMKNQLAIGHSGGEEAENWDIITLGGAGGIRSTVSDMVKFIQANMGVTKSELFEAMQLTHQSSFKDVKGKREMGLAWHIENGEFLMHNGATGGYRAMAAIKKGDKKGVVVLTNSDENVDTIAIKLMVPSYKLKAMKPSIGKIVSKEIETNGVEKAIALYKKMKLEQSQNFDFGEEELNTVGYHYLAEDAIDTALAIFKLNVAEFPKASNPYDSLGEAYLEKGNKEKAIENYKKSLVLDPSNDNARDVLKRLNVTLKEVIVSLEMLKSYIGKYQLTPTFYITVTNKDGRLFAQATGQAKFEIFASDYNKFYYKVVAAKIEFNANTKGKIDSLTLFQNGRELVGKKIE